VLPQGPDAHAALARGKAQYLGWFANFIDEFTDPEEYAKLVRQIERKRPGSAQRIGVDSYRRGYSTNRYYTPKRGRVHRIEGVSAGEPHSVFEHSMIWTAIRGLRRVAFWRCVAPEVRTCGVATLAYYQQRSTDEPLALAAPGWHRAVASLSYRGVSAPPPAGPAFPLGRVTPSGVARPGGAMSKQVAGARTSCPELKRPERARAPV
jgi:hypothetical protein